jgi:HEAT repeat protein
LQCLAELGTPEAVAALVAFTADPDKRNVCVSALASLDESLIDYVARGLTHEKKIVRLAVVDALARMKHPYATEQLKLALEDADSAVRVAAESALAIIGAQGSFPTS